MKKLFAAFIAVCLLLTLTACNNQSTLTFSSADTPMATTTIADEQKKDNTTAAVTDSTSGSKATKVSKTDKQSITKTKATADTDTDAAATSSKSTAKTQMTRATRTTTGAVATTRRTGDRTYPAGKTIRVSCVGDSITKNGYWENNMQGMLSSQYAVSGFGRDGANVLSGVGNYYPSLSEYFSSLTSTPDIVVIMLGTNDARPRYWGTAEDNTIEAFKKEYIALVESYQSLTSAPQVIIALPPTVYVDDYDTITPSILINEINPALKEIAAKTGCLLVDTYSATVNADWKTDFADGVHPSTENGRKILAKAVADVIKAETKVS